MAPKHHTLADIHAFNRRIYARLPWGYRVAGLLTILAADALSAFGLVIYAEFIKSVVRGMPDAGGIPAFDWIQKVQGPKGADKLPPGYGREFGSRVYKILLAKFGADADVADEAMANVMMAAARGRLHIANGSSLHSAEAYVITAAFNAARDLLRSRDRRREVSLTRDRDDDDGWEIDVEDPSAFAKVQRALTPDELRKILRELEDVHARAPSYVAALMHGDNQATIARDWWGGVSPSYMSKWLRQYGPGVREVFERHLRAATRTMVYSYERHVRAATRRALLGYDYARLG